VSGARTSRGRREVVYRGALAWRLISTTALPTIVALTEIGLRNGTMPQENAASLVGAGVLRVLVLPALAVALDRRHGTASLDSSTGVGLPHSVPAQ
jgi:hypothetical protein